MLISIITPVYNEEKNIYNCYAHLCKQTFKNFEWIVINDGSSDNTVSILKDIMSHHNNSLFSIKLLEQKNSGIAIARKFGIENALGSWICALDCDDYLSNNALSLVVDKIAEDIDIVYFNVETVTQDGNFIRRLKIAVDSLPIDGKVAFSKCIDGWGLPGFGVVRKYIYEKAYSLRPALNTRHNSHSDELITRYNMYCSRQVDCCDGVYYYVNNPESTTQRINKNLHTFVNTAIELYTFIRDNEYENKELQIRVQLHLLNSFHFILGKYIRWINLIDNHKEWRESLYKICTKINLTYCISNSRFIIKNYSIWYLINSILKVDIVRAMRYIDK